MRSHFGSVAGRTHAVYGVVRPCVELKSIIIYFLRRVLDNGDFLAPPLPGPLSGVFEFSRPRFALEFRTAGANDLLHLCFFSAVACCGPCHAQQR